MDIVLVDGPSTWSSELNNSRYPALPFLNERLASSFSFYLHDIQRKTERQIIDSWRKEFGLQFENVNHRLSYTNKGNYFNSII